MQIRMVFPDIVKFVIQINPQLSMAFVLNAKVLNVNLNIFRSNITSMLNIIINAICGGYLGWLLADLGLPLQDFKFWLAILAILLIGINFSD